MKEKETQENERIETIEPPCVTIPPASTLSLMQCSEVRGSGDTGNKNSMSVGQNPLLQKKMILYTTHFL